MRRTNRLDRTPGLCFSQDPNYLFFAESTSLHVLLYLELRTEAADLMPRIAWVANNYGVPVYSGAGMDGLKPKKEAAGRCRRA